MKLSTAIGLSLALAASCFALGFAPANATERPWYVKAEIGASAQTEIEGIELEDGSVYGGAVGTAIGPVRVEVGARSLNVDTFGVNLSSIDYNATAYLDLAVGESSSVFVGAGVDYVDAEASFGYGDYQTSAYGWHASAGYARRITPGVIVEGQARYTDIGFDGFDANTTDFTVGVRLAL